MTTRIEDPAIRRYRPGDLEDVYRLTCETIATSYAEVYAPSVIDFFHQYHERSVIRADAESGQIVVVHSSGELVGTGTRVEGDVRRVFIRSDRQRRGIGRLVMAELEADARAERVERLSLSASLPALEFYLALGYEVVSEEDYEVAPGDQLEYYEMSKQLVR